MDVVWRSRVVWACLGAVVLALPACRVTNWPLWQAPAATQGACEVRRVPDVAYYEGAQADAVRHRLDLFVPKGVKDFPVIVLIHGGAWTMGDNRCCGLYSSVGQYLASQGIGVALPNYRLSPKVRHPAHAKDVAHAFAWVKQHIGEYGGRADQLFLAGHSAGGHLAALLTTDPRYLEAEGCRTRDIRGVMCVSGVYRIPNGNVDVLLGGTAGNSFRFDEIGPLRGPTASAKANAAERSGLALKLNIFGAVFGDDPEVRRAASPVEYVRAGLPPFLFVNAEKDLPLLPDMADEMHRKLRRHGCETERMTIANRNHNSVMFQAVEPNDPVARALVEFVRGRI